LFDTFPVAPSVRDVNRPRVLVALAMMVAGALLTLDGPGGVTRAGRLLAEHGGIVLIALAVAALLAAMAPRGTVVGPVVVGLIGVGLVGARAGLWSAEALWTAGGTGLVVVGGWVVMASVSPAAHDFDPAWRRRAILWPRTIEVSDENAWPQHLGILAVGTKVEVDLRRGRRPVTAFLELAVSCWGGRVEVYLPPHWRVLPGRVHAATAVRLKGRLDDTEPLRDPHAPGAEKRIAAMGGNDVVVVIHIVGLGGEVQLIRDP